VFILHYFSHRIKELKEFHLELIDVATTAKRGLILYPAAHGKTTIVSELLPIYEICKDPNVRIAIIAKNETDAEGIMRSIQSELTDNEDWSVTSARSNPKATTAKHGRSETRRGETDPSRQILHHHRVRLRRKNRPGAPHRPDDLRRRNHREELGHRRAAVQDAGVVHPVSDDRAGRRDDRIIVVGTLFDPKDLYNYLLDLDRPEDQSPLWEVRRVDAVVDETSGSLCGLSRCRGNG
jgi:hypothetical protein